MRFLDKVMSLNSVTIGCGFSKHTRRWTSSRLCWRVALALVVSFRSFAKTASLRATCSCNSSSSAVRACTPSKKIEVEMEPFDCTAARLARTLKRSQPTNPLQRMYKRMFTIKLQCCCQEDRNKSACLSLQYVN